MKKTKELNKRIKTWYSKKPKHNIWFYIAVICIIDKYLVRGTSYLIGLQLGLLSPDSTPAFENVSQNLADSFVDMFNSTFVVGQQISTTNPTIGYYFGQSIGFILIYGILLIVFYLVHGMIRHGVVHLYNKYKKSKR